jgi:hypothetical protein
VSHASGFAAVIGGHIPLAAGSNRGAMIAGMGDGRHRYHYRQLVDDDG